MQSREKIIVFHSHLMQFFTARRRNSRGIEVTFCHKHEDRSHTQWCIFLRQEVREKLHKAKLSESASERLHTEKCRFMGKEVLE